MIALPTGVCAEGAHAWRKVWWWTGRLHVCSACGALAVWIGKGFGWALYAANQTTEG